MARSQWIGLLCLSALAALTTLSAACGDDCPNGYVEVDSHCVPKKIAAKCQFVGSSGPGEDCEKTADCKGCFVVCLTGACFAQRLEGESCTRDVECRSQTCNLSTNLCNDE
ncbi:MAG: EB domain-containing protein [Myxococcota bacterium]